MRLVVCGWGRGGTSATTEAALEVVPDGRPLGPYMRETYCTYEPEALCRWQDERLHGFTRAGRRPGPASLVREARALWADTFPNPSVFVWKSPQLGWSWRWWWRYGWPHAERPQAAILCVRPLAEHVDACRRWGAKQTRAELATAIIDSTENVRTCAAQFGVPLFESQFDTLRRDRSAWQARLVQFLATCHSV